MLDAWQKFFFFSFAPVLYRIKHRNASSQIYCVMQLLFSGLSSDKKWSPNLCLLRYLSQFRKGVAGRISAQFQKETAARIWPAGRRLPTPNLSYYSSSNRVPNLPMVKPFSVYRSPSSLETLRRVVSRARVFLVGSSSAWILRKTSGVNRAGRRIKIAIFSEW